MGNDTNLCIFTGHLGATPETRYTTSGSAVTNFNLAVGQSWKKDGEKQEKTEWIRCVAFGKVAEIIAQYLLKGSFVLINGRLQSRKYEDKGGNDRYITEIIVNQMQMLGGTPKETTESSPAYGTEDDIPVPF